MLGIEGLACFPDGVDQVQELAHAMAHGHVAAFTFGFEAAVQGAQREVRADAGQGRHPQISANQIIATWRHDHGTRR